MVVPRVFLSSSWVPSRVIVCAVANVIELNVMVVRRGEVGEVDRGPQVELSRWRTDAVGGHIDDQRDRDCLVSTDVGIGCIERKPAGRYRGIVIPPIVLTPLPMAGLPVSSAMVWVGPP